MNYPFYTPQPPPQRPTTPVALPPSRRLSQTRTRPEAYLPDNGLVNAVNVALLLGQPLLLTGEPGTGKTQLADSLAYQLGLGDPFKFETKSTSTARDLFYFYDALSHFRAIQTNVEKPKPADYFTFGALGKAILLTRSPEENQEFLSLLDSDFRQPCRSVVLIDEIDKAPRDFPNDILNEVENLYFHIPEWNNRRVQADPQLSPILVLTSNSEKHLPDAFLRRCIYYHISFPDHERLVKIVETRLGENLKQGSPFLTDALEIFAQLRQAGLRKKPATAELLNWLQVLRELFKEEENPLATNTLERVKQTLSSLVKAEEDQGMARQKVGEWLRKGDIV